MDYIKYIDKFETAEDVQTAIDNGELNKPYVAKVGDALDFNSMTPITPTMGEWNYDEEHHIYNIYISEQDPSYWVEPTLIATFPSICNGNEVTARIWLSFAEGEWVVKFDAEGESSEEEFPATPGIGGLYDTSYFLIPGVPGASSDVSVHVAFDGSAEFEFTSGDYDNAPLEMDTINPEYPE